MRVSGQLVGRRVGFDVEVHEAGDGRLALSAHGPVAFDVAYEARPRGSGSEVCASVSVRAGGGLFGRLAEQATAALLQAGALGLAVDRIARVRDRLKPKRKEPPDDRCDPRRPRLRRRSPSPLAR